MKKWQVFPVIPVMLLAFGLRLWGLADHNIWWDEGLAAWAARLPVERILDWTAHDVHPPLYFLHMMYILHSTSSSCAAGGFSSATANLCCASRPRLSACLAWRRSMD
jgi:hypothetical protein